MTELAAEFESEKSPGSGGVNILGLSTDFLRTFRPGLLRKKNFRSINEQIKAFSSRSVGYEWGNARDNPLIRLSTMTA